MHRLSSLNISGPLVARYYCLTLAPGAQEAEEGNGGSKIQYLWLQDGFARYARCNRKDFKDQRVLKENYVNVKIEIVRGGSDFLSLGDTSKYTSAVILCA